MPQTSIGALIGWGLGAYGKKPKVPALAEIKPGEVQKATVAENIAAFADAAKLATQVNQFSQDQLEALLERALPGGREQIQRVIGSQLRGEVPEDVSRAIFRSTAERGLGPFAGGGFTRNVMARDLGLTSLGLIEQGLNSAQRWMAQATAPQFNVTSMFFSPQQRLGFEETQQVRRFERDVMAAGVKAAPEPWRAALAQGIDADIARLEEAALSYAGMGMGGGGGGGGDPGMGGGGGGFGGGGFGGGAGFGGSGWGGDYGPYGGLGGGPTGWGMHIKYR